MRYFTTFIFTIFMMVNFSFVYANSPISGDALGEDIDISADKVSFDNQGGLLKAEGDVILLSGEIKIRCQKAVINQATGGFEAWDAVTITQGLNFWEGDKVSGNYKTEELQTGEFLSKHSDIYLKTKNAHRYPKDEVADGIEDVKKAGTTEVEGAVLTTCDYLESGHAHYTVEAKKVTIQADGYFKAEDVVFKIGDTPFFWLPVLWTKDSSGIDVDIKGGYRSSFGAFVKLSKPMQINENVTTEWLVDFYTKRGFGFGNETDVNTTNTRTNLFVYGINDWDAPETDEIVAVPTPPNPPGVILATDDKKYNKRFEKVEKRYRLKLSHHTDITPEWAIDARVDKLSDIDMLEDWFEKEYDNIFQPASEVSVNYLSEKIHLSLNVRPQINDFYSVVEKLPELRADFLRTEIADSGVFYQGDVTVADMKMSWREVDRNRPNYMTDLENYDALRFDTMHSFYMPINYDNWLTIIPRAGVRATYYSKSSENEVSIDDLNKNFDVADPDNVTGEEIVNNYDDLGGDLWRFTGEVGLEMSFKKYKTWQNYNNETLRLDGMRHIIEPYLNITSIIKPNTDKDNIYFFDEKDRVDELNFVRVGLKQRFQTRRNRKIYTFASIENYADFHATTRDNIQHLGDFATMLKVNPDDDLTIWTRLMIGMDGFDLNEWELGTSFGDYNTLKTSISYLYRGDFQAAPVYSMNSYLSDYSSNSYFERYYDRSHSVRVDFDFPINEKTRGRIGFLVDLEQQDLVKHYYELQRDMHCWVGALRLGVDDGDFEAMIMFHLKALPSLKLGSSSKEYAPKEKI